ncbi:MAG: Killer protein [Rickettsiaceae bacterium]|jgi:proteic killer suppression protein|nr:Killer protein [Rickettsiaceae bacterium]
MIKSFAHKGLEAFFEKGTTKGIDANHSKKLRLVLNLLDAAEVVEDVNFPNSRLHQLQGQRKGTWSVAVNGAWRVTFRIEDKNVYIVNYEQYH